jgi:hypothetical protein
MGSKVAGRGKEQVKWVEWQGKGRVRGRHLSRVQPPIMVFLASVTCLATLPDIHHAKLTQHVHRVEEKISSGGVSLLIWLAVVVALCFLVLCSLLITGLPLLQVCFPGSLGPSPAWNPRKTLSMMALLKCWPPRESTLEK